MHCIAYLTTRNFRNLHSETCCYNRNLCYILTKTPNLQSLRLWRSCLKGQWCRTFEGRYGNLLSLLEIEVQPTALSALTQYYDPPLRCFTFKDFQLAPTLEENGLEGLLKASIEERLHQLQREGDWPAFMDVYRLLVYGIVLFSQIEDHIDLAVVDAFLAKRDRGENPFIAVLANTYYTLDYCHERTGES
ncbi:hypothetical protein CR513_50410, partial [Mucuna pruriens]